MIGIPAGNEFRVNTTTASAQDTASVAVDAQGNYVVVWESFGQDGDRDGVYAQRYDHLGNAIGGEILVNTSTSDEQGDPVVAMDANGNFVVAWTDRDPLVATSGAVYARRFDSNGNALGSQFLVNTTTTNAQDTPAIAMNADGRFVITWESFDQDGDGDGVYAQVYDSLGNEVGGEIAVNTTTTDEQGDPVVGIDANGNFVIAWTDRNPADSTSGAVRARRFDSAGNPLGSQFLVNTTTTDAQDTPAIAMNANGDFVIAWESFNQDGDGEGVYAQRYSNTGAAVGGEIAVNTTTSSNQDDPSVAIDAAGNFLVAWESFGQDGSSDGVYGQYFDTAGAKVGTEFRINTFTNSSQSEVALAMDADGNAIAVWQSFEQDGDSNGVYAQQFGIPSVVEFSQGNYILNEEGTVIGSEVTLTRTHDLLTSEVQVTVAGGSATAGADYTNSFPLTVTFNPGETSKTVTIPVLEDLLIEGTETLNLSLIATSNASIGSQNSTTVNIIDIVPSVGLNLVGTANDDVLLGSDHDDIIRGLAGDDRLKGRSGDDRMIGGGGKDKLIGGSDDDILKGGGDNDKLVGNAGDDILNGGGGNDKLKGGSGEDVLQGQKGNDKLFGGADNDIFVLKKGHGTDLIRDFELGDDLIQLQGSLSFSDLTFQQQGNKALIIADGEELAVLQGIQTSQLSQANFI
ncbi:MAG: Calx-beta domain-containing protein [Leptolyngbyaceae bacterium]|nr:Calx-beta domain-containing protein [Leptolyngbyaceae bacterium]